MAHSICRKEQQTRRKLEKAETAAKLETTIENELLERLQKGTYGDIYNFPTREYLKVWEYIAGGCDQLPLLCQWTSDRTGAPHLAQAQRPKFPNHLKPQLRRMFMH